MKKTASSVAAPYVSPGMPDLDLSGNNTSFFEFWPTWLIYIPVVAQCLWLGLRHRSFTLPLLANPSLPLSGMVGVPKSTLFEQAKGQCQQQILPWLKVERDQRSPTQQVSDVLKDMLDAELSFPLVGKPDIGCRGAGVKLLHDEQQLAACLAAYPAGASLLLQKLASFEAEAGVFYVRHPEQAQGQIISLALKYTPYVVGDGQSNLRQLIEQDPRAKDLQHLYLERHQDQLERVLAEGEPYKLVFSASHCRGAIFRNAEDLITPELNQAIDALMQDIPDFHYGRLDIKFSNTEALAQGQDLEIVEINSASSESLHIWDRNTGYREAIRALLFQYRTLFQLGAAQRRKGLRPPSFKSLLKHWQMERQLTAHYPETD